MKIAARMLEFAQNTGNDELEAYWGYALKSLDVLGNGCMSPEEDAEEDIITDGVHTKRTVRVVPILAFRHKSFQKMFEIIDKTPGVEDLIFHQSGRTRLPRKRVSTIDRRDPPKRLPESVFDQEYLAKLSRYQKEELEFEGDFQIRE